VWWFVSMAWASCFPASGGSGPRLPAPEAPFVEEVRIEGMVARWRAEGDHWVVQLEGETEGWLVFGTNQTSEIEGATLFFGWVADGAGGAAEHTVLAPGRHAPVARPRVRLLASDRAAGRTAVRLRIPAPELDDDQGVWLVLAWSRSVSLDHHSAVRRHVRVRAE